MTTNSIAANPDSVEDLLQGIADDSLREMARIQQQKAIETRKQLLSQQLASMKQALAADHDKLVRFDALIEGAVQKVRTTIKDCRAQFGRNLQVPDAKRAINFALDQLKLLINGRFETEDGIAELERRISEAEAQTRLAPTFTPPAETRPVMITPSHVAAMPTSTLEARIANVQAALRANESIPAAALTDELREARERLKSTLVDLKAAAELQELAS